MCAASRVEDTVSGKIVPEKPPDLLYEVTVLLPKGGKRVLYTLYLIRLQSINR